MNCCLVFLVGLPKPVAVYPFNAQDGTKDVGSFKLPSATAVGVKLLEGPDGKPGGSYYFSGGASSYVEIPSHAKLDTSFSITVMMWVKPRSDGPLFHFHPSGWLIHLWVIADPLRFYWRVVKKSGARPNPLKYPVKDGTWQHVTATYQYSTGMARLFVDQIMIKELNIGTFEIASAEPVRIGKTDHDRRYFRGRVSCIQVYDIALTQEEIAATKNRCFLPSGKEFSWESVDSSVVFFQYSDSSFVTYRLLIGVRFVTGSPILELVFSPEQERCCRLSRFYKTLYGNKHRVRKIVANWCKQHK